MGTTVILDEIHACRSGKASSQDFGYCRVSSRKYGDEEYHYRAATLPGILIQKIQEILDTEDIIRSWSWDFEASLRGTEWICDGDLLEERWLWGSTRESQTRGQCSGMLQYRFTYPEETRIHKGSLRLEPLKLFFAWAFYRCRSSRKENGFRTSRDPGLKSRGPVVVVSTQVVEVKVDID